MQANSAEQNGYTSSHSSQRASAATTPSLSHAVLARGKVGGGAERKRTKKQRKQMPEKREKERRWKGRRGKGKQQEWREKRQTFPTRKGERKRGRCKTRHEGSNFPNFKEKRLKVREVNLERERERGRQRTEDRKREHKAFKSMSASQRGEEIISKSVARLWCYCVDQFI